VKKLLLIVGVLAVLGAGAALTATGLTAQTRGGSHRIVRTVGSETFAPNQRISSNLRFNPGDIRIRTGGTLTLTNSDSTHEPHTLSIVNQDDVPANIDDVFNCGAPDTVCDAIFTLIGPSDNPPRTVEAPGSMPGLDARLDTLVIFPGESVDAQVSAPAGTTLYYICAIHPWMQGRIIVTE
jgi:plastocyanin